MKLYLFAAAAGFSLLAAEAPPKQWIDPDTGHRIVRLTDEPGSASLYFNQNGYTKDGKGLLYTSPAGVHVLNLETRATGLIVKGRARLIDAGRKTASLYFTRDGAVYQANMATGEERKIAVLPPRGGIAFLPLIALAVRPSMPCARRGAQAALSPSLGAPATPATWQVWHNCV